MNNILIIQARLGSKRFRNKVIRKINQNTLIEILLKRISKSPLYKVVVAIPDTIENDKLFKILKKKEIEVFKGDENDVLSRYYYAAKY